MASSRSPTAPAMPHVWGIAQFAAKRRPQRRRSSADECGWRPLSGGNSGGGSSCGRRLTDAAFAIAYARPLSALGRNRELLALKPIEWVGPPDPLISPGAPAVPAPADEEQP